MYIPKLGPQVPRHNSRLARLAGKLILRLTGWRFKGEVPNLSKFIMIGAPHTSNWDAFYGFAALLAMGIRVNWMGKHTLFPRPIGWLVRALGGIPINRTASCGIVDQTKRAFAEREQLVLVLTPEGTRKRVPKWKSGFYFMAKESGVPILVGFLDYSRKELGFGPLIYPSGDLEQDFRQIQEFYRPVKGKRPERFNYDILGEG